MRLGELVRLAMKWLFESRAGRGKRSTLPPRVALMTHEGCVICVWTEAAAPRVQHVAWRAGGPLTGTVGGCAKTLIHACRQIDDWIRSRG